MQIIQELTSHKQRQVLSYSRSLAWHSRVRRLSQLGLSIRIAWRMLGHALTSEVLAGAILNVSAQVLPPDKAVSAELALGQPPTRMQMRLKLHGTASPVLGEVPVSEFTVYPTSVVGRERRGTLRTREGVRVGLCR